MTDAQFPPTKIISPTGVMYGGFLYTPQFDFRRALRTIATTASTTASWPGGGLRKDLPSVEAMVEDLSEAFEGTLLEEIMAEAALDTLRSLTDGDSLRFMLRLWSVWGARPGALEEVQLMFCEKTVSSETGGILNYVLGRVAAKPKDK